VDFDSDNCEFVFLRLYFSEIQMLIYYNFVLMKSDLDELIELCEAERQLLEDCIKDNTTEWEYLHAYFHSKALFKINNQLRILHKLKDPFYEKKLELERMNEIYKKWDKLKPESAINAYYQKKIEDNKEKLQELNQQKDKTVYDDQKIDDALFNLSEGAYKGFILYLNLKDDLGFTFELSENNMLHISISIKNLLNVEYFFYDDENDGGVSPLNIFKGLGFLLNDTGNKLIYKYDMKNFKDAASIKILLSRIIYDIFAYAGLDNTASLVYF
jgi:hypothetical protein